MTKKWKQTINGAVICMVSIGLVFLMCFSYFTMVQRVTADEVRASLKEVSQHISLLVENKMKDNLSGMETMASAVAASPDISSPAMMNFLQRESTRYGYARIAVVTPDGNSLSNDGLMNNVSGRKYFQSAMSGVSNIEDSIMAVDDNVESVVYAVPIIRDGKTAGILRATTHLSELQKTLEITSFGGEGYSLIVRRDGSCVVPSVNSNSVGKFSNAFMAIKDAKFFSGSIDFLREEMTEGNSGTVEYSLNGLRKYVHYQPLEINGWYLLSVTPAAVYADKTATILRSTFAICAGISVLFIICLGYVLKSRRKLRDIAFTDSATGLPNDTRFKINAAGLLKNWQRDDYALVSLDINKFKLINDMYGYSAGNKVLRHVASCIQKHLEKNETFSRVTGDKFQILMHYRTDINITERLEALTKEINRFNLVAPNPYYLEITYGVYRIKDRSLDIHLMNDRASIARKSIKDKHNVYIAFYHDDSRNRMIEEKEIENRMESALENGEFLVYLQPKFELEHERIAGAEALVRWMHPTKGLLPPSVFIPLFERDGFIIKLDYYMFEEVCKHLRQWLDEGIQPVPVSVNLSRVHLRDLQFVEFYQKVTAKYCIPPNLIEIELTENLVFENMDMLLGVINNLKGVGFSCSLDDFGTGYSSLNVLKEIPVDVLKLDREFFNEPKDVRRSNTVVSGVVSMAKSLGIRTVSEGVENEKQVQFLRDIGCDMVQGYVFAKPMPVDEFKTLLKQHSEKIKNPAENRRK